MALRLAALAGGVGGARLVEGLAANLPPDRLTVIVNTGDDFDHLGLRIWPDWDTVTYTLAGLANPDTGWGRQGDSWVVMETLASLGGPTWFRLGDRDLALHLERTRRIRLGQPASAIARDLRDALGVRVAVLPMSDELIRTIVDTEEGPLAFQEYFVARACEPRVVGFRFEGSVDSRPGPGVLEAMDQADALVLCPSNPWVSLDPILSVPGIREAVGRRPVIGVSPIVRGRAIRGPAAKMFAELGILPTARAVAEHFRDLLHALVIDEQDRGLQAPIQELGMQVRVCQTVMRSAADRCRLAAEVLGLAASLSGGRAG